MNLVKAIVLTEKEKEILKKADELLEEIYRQVEDKYRLQNWETGELIDVAEIPRVRGIIGGLAECRDWEIM